MEDTLIKHIKKFSERGIDEDTAIEDFVDKETSRIKLPARPTFTAPGSIERLRVYSERYARGEAVFHPKDSDFMGRRGGQIDRISYTAIGNKTSIRKM